MLPEKTNLVDELLKKRRKTIREEELLAAVKAILTADEEHREAIRQRIGENNGDEGFNKFNFDLLETDRIFHISQIKATCIDYRLRFLDSSLFKSYVPDEAVSRIKSLEKAHDTVLSGFKIMAPSKQFHLKNYDDPLLFAPIGNDYYYLIYKWGNDLSPFRKLLVRPFRDFGSLLVFLVAVSVLLTLAVSGKSVHGVAQDTFLLLMFLFIFKSVCGVALYYCFWKGKNFNTAIWDSEYYNR
ncbi:hypothetical protein CHU92_03370 [Flavobacterium cyanobacteriorum]|uniref:Uncharacterized protein n=1 Tax=Flavobacterium cyanobacteriorum TaxID=2022802 RepID=A0A255ZRD4_9FLAO|nr:hypothetical protein [Flavobacterium cyanobacteriorum]OYQ43494.1 hypothetical protein CHU92_03370 [Flavobacterium cyanobacteriorum]